MKKFYWSMGVFHDWNNGDEIDADWLKGIGKFLCWSASVNRWFTCAWDGDYWAWDLLPEGAI